MSTDPAANDGRTETIRFGSDEMVAELVADLRTINHSLRNALCPVLMAHDNDMVEMLAKVRPVIAAIMENIEHLALAAVEKPAPAKSEYKVHLEAFKKRRASVSAVPVEEVTA